MNLNQITLPSNDISASRKFYLILGFTLIVDSEQYLRFWCEEGDATFSLHLNNDASFKNAAVIYFECVDVDKKYQTLLSLGFDRNGLNRNRIPCCGNPCAVSMASGGGVAGSRKPLISRAPSCLRLDETT